MDIYFPVEEAVVKRTSVRNYSEQEIEGEKRQKLEDFIAALDNPFGVKVQFHYLDSAEVQREEKLGTYGVIKGAKHYLGATIQNEPMALEALGYELEAVMLYLAYLGIGTCWLGGTFNRKAFAKAMAIEENALFPAVTPYGYAAAKKHIKENLMRKMIGADSRKPWDELFYSEDFSTPLTKEKAGKLAFPLEMVRLAPSASNKQPWRALLKKGACHFYESKTPGYSDAFPYDIQRVDLGIAAVHFDLALREKGLKGHFSTANKPEIYSLGNMEYVFSWVKD